MSSRRDFKGQRAAPFIKSRFFKVPVTEPVMAGGTFEKKAGDSGSLHMAQL